MYKHEIHLQNFQNITPDFADDKNSYNLNIWYPVVFKVSMEWCHIADSWFKERHCIWIAAVLLGNHWSDVKSESLSETLNHCYSLSAVTVTRDGHGRHCHHKKEEAVRTMKDLLKTLFCFSVYASSPDR